MYRRFKLGIIGFVATLVLLSNLNHELLQGFGAIFVMLAALLIFAIVGLFPSVNRGDMVDRSKAGGSWSDHIEFDEPEAPKSSGESWR